MFYRSVSKFKQLQFISKRFTLYSTYVENNLKESIAMPRPSRCRRVCAEPIFKTFGADTNETISPITLFVDEYEVIRLVDYEERTHEQCAEQMQISRTTVTEIYEKARFKLADAIVNGKKLVISGGHYKTCQGIAQRNCPGRCRWRRGNQSQMKNTFEGANIMKIAIPVKNENIYQHFGMASVFKIYTVENNQITATTMEETNGRGHGAMLDVLLANAVNCVICGGIGDGAIQALNQADIKLYAGISGVADDAVASLIAGTLQSDMQAACSKHQHAHPGQCAHGDCGQHHGNCHCDCK